MVPASVKAINNFVGLRIVSSTTIRPIGHLRPPCLFVDQSSMFTLNQKITENSTERPTFRTVREAIATSGRLGSKGPKKTDKDRIRTGDP